MLHLSGSGHHNQPFLQAFSSPFSMNKYRGDSGRRGNARTSTMEKSAGIQRRTFQRSSRPRISLEEKKKYTFTSHQTRTETSSWIHLWHLTLVQKTDPTVCQETRRWQRSDTLSLLCFWVRSLPDKSDGCPVPDLRATSEDQSHKHENDCCDITSHTTESHPPRSHKGSAPL